ncbi:pol Retrovirus-related Pol polyprotein from transposon-like 6 [Homarus americanus]|uniref:Pol Retrovirus-related Pol polyprotein from transposon-like 6 n=1 Tax=Homarus americanus TaxID=6706 RepID=A0A8J5TW74_HOMAM|nr:pol Retrovirus-related Pol polyprotein from transposon-like 6 [Homarus americanus]
MRDGLFSYCTQWISHFSDNVRPLVKAQTFPLKEEAVSAFENLKKEIASAVVSSIDKTIPFLVETDASDSSIAASLNQAGRPFAFFSRTLSQSGGPPDFQPASQAIENILAVLPPKMCQPIDTDIGNDEPLPLGLIQVSALNTKSPDLTQGVGTGMKLRHQYQTPKKVAARNVEKSCELDVELLHSKLKTEKLAQEYYDLKREKQKKL